MAKRKSNKQVKAMIELITGYEFIACSESDRSSLCKFNDSDSWFWEYVKLGTISIDANGHSCAVCK